MPQVTPTNSHGYNESTLLVYREFMNDDPWVEAENLMLLEPVGSVDPNDSM